MMHSEFFLVDQCTRISVEANTDVSSFTCGDDDLDDFFHNEAKLYSEQLLGKAYLTGCRFLVVDAYNEESVLSFYSKNGFKPLYATEDLERAAFHIADGEKLHSRMFYFDLMQFLTTT